MKNNLKRSTKSRDNYVSILEHKAFTNMHIYGNVLPYTWLPVQICQVSSRDTEKLRKFLFHQNIYRKWRCKNFVQKILIHRVNNVLRNYKRISPSDLTGENSVPMQIMFQRIYSYKGFTVTSRYAKWVITRCHL